MAEQRTINWTPTKLRALKQHIKQAIVEGRETFTIPAGVVDVEPAEFDRRYAEYLAQYLESKLGKE